MSHKMIGMAEINGSRTSIRKYDNGFFGVELDGVVKYSGITLDELTKKLDADKIKYTLS